MKTPLSIPILAVAVLAACGGAVPSAGFTVDAPDALTTPAGASTYLDLSVKGAAQQPVTFAVESARFTATVSGARVRIDVPKDTQPGSDSLTIRATDASGAEAKATVRLDVPPAAKPPTKAAGIHVDLDAFFYADGATAKVTVDLGGRTPPAQVGDVVLVSAESHDVEKLSLSRRADGLYESTTGVVVHASDAAGVPLDGTFTLPAGGVFVAFFGVDTSQPGYGDLEATSYSDLGVLEGVRPGAPASRVEPSLALTTDEDPLPTGARPVGTILRAGNGPGAGMPLQLATHELVLFHQDQATLDRFLAVSHGTLLETETVDSGSSSLVEIDPSSLTPERLALVRALAGDDGELLASRSDAQAIYGLALAFRLDGFVVAVNPRLSYHEAPHLTGDEAATVNSTMAMRGSRTETASCLPGSVDRPCTTDVPALWTYLALMDLDRTRVKVAVLDMGFAPNSDFRTNEDGSIDMCDFTSRPMRCGPGTALGPPTVGASVVGPRVWHGTGVVTTLGGVVGNDGSAGVAGQVAVPMLYKYDLAAYAFDLGGGIRRALANGAQVINISAGYPCTVVTRIGPDFDICSEEGRLGICAVVTAVAHTAAIAFCTSPAAGILIVGQAICGGLVTAAVLATNACLSTIALGNVRSTMASAVNAATSAGVPVVASAGNVLPASAFPEGVRDYVNFGEERTEAWGIIPATLPGVLAIGAAEGDALPNTQFFGERIDVWAPSGSAFISPDDANPGMTFRDTIGATSGAAPYVSGVIAAMQTVNPSLDPARATAAERATAVARVRGFLVGTATPNATLSARGFANDSRRRNLVDPLAAVLAAAQGQQVDLRGLGYDTSLNFREADGDDDTEARARSLSFDTNVAGTIVSLGTAPQDQDWYRFTVPTMTGRVFASDLTLRWVGTETPTLMTGSGAAPMRVTEVMDGVEHVATYRLVRSSGEAVSLRVTAADGLDVPYQLRVSTPAALTPTVTIEEPVLPAGATVCANTPVTFRASVRYPGSAITGTSVAWTVDGATLPSTSLTTSISQAAGVHVVTASWLGGTDSKTVTFANCTVIADITSPTANIMRYADGIDSVGPYLNVTFSARALDAMGAVIDPSTLVFEWTTNRGDCQPGGPASGTQSLGTGASLGSLRIYGLGGSVAETHVITLTVRASPGGPVLSTDTVQIIVQNLI